MDLVPNTVSLSQAASLLGVELWRGDRKIPFFHSVGISQDSIIVYVTKFGSPLALPLKFHGWPLYAIALGKPQPL